MREARKRVRKRRQNLPIAALVGHPWHYRGMRDKIDGNMRGLLLDLKTWAREKLVESVVPAGYYLEPGNAESAFRALQKETLNQLDVWLYAWVPNSTAEAMNVFESAGRLKTRQILFWEADYIADRPGATEIQRVMREHSG
jgi:hypothetical protein